MPSFFWFDLILGASAEIPKKKYLFFGRHQKVILKFIDLYFNLFSTYLHYVLLMLSISFPDSSPARVKTACPLEPISWWLPVRFGVASHMGSFWQRKYTQKSHGGQFTWGWSFVSFFSCFDMRWATGCLECNWLLISSTNLYQAMSDLESVNIWTLALYYRLLFNS